MKSMYRLFFLLTTGLFLTLAGTASATNGYFTHGTGTKNKGMAGAGIAGATDAIAMANNPAAAIFAIGKLDAGAALFEKDKIPVRIESHDDIDLLVGLDAKELHGLSHGVSSRVYEAQCECIGKPAERKGTV